MKEGEKEGRREGRKEGEKEGRKEGRKEGKNLGGKEGRKEENKESISEIHCLGKSKAFYTCIVHFPLLGPCIGHHSLSSTYPTKKRIVIVILANTIVITRIFLIAIWLALFSMPMTMWEWAPVAVFARTATPAVIRETDARVAVSTIGHVTLVDGFCTAWTVSVLPVVSSLLCCCSLSSFTPYGTWWGCFSTWSSLMRGPSSAVCWSPGPSCHFCKCPWSAVVGNRRLSCQSPVLGRVHL